MKLVGLKGGFYRLAGDQARLIDDITGTTPPYDQTIVLGPDRPADWCRANGSALGVGVAVVDVNDLGRVKVLAASRAATKRCCSGRCGRTPPGMPTSALRLCWCVPPKLHVGLRGSPRCGNAVPAAISRKSAAVSFLHRSLLQFVCCAVPVPCQLPVPCQRQNLPGWTVEAPPITLRLRRHRQGCPPTGACNRSGLASAFARRSRFPPPPSPCCSVPCSWPCRPAVRP